MRLFVPRIGAGPHGVVALFGEGLIGSAVATALRRPGVADERLPFSWTDSGQQACDAEAIVRRVTEVLTSHGRSAARLAVAWCAGKCGFGATETQAEEELASFRRVLSIADEASGAARAVSFHLVSSAGALFEGQRHVTSATTPDPRRVYGHLKLRQESLALEHGAFERVGIYRPSTVYGAAAFGYRRGLVSVLATNGLRRAVTSITGQAGTMRDYVWNHDLGRCIADEIETCSDTTAHLLVSGYPATIAEVKALVERALRRSLYVQYSLAPDNTSDITFRRPSRMPTWRPVDLESGIRQTCDDCLALLAGGGLAG